MSEACTGIVLLARTSSSRLPRKSLLEVCGKPIIEHQIARLRRSALASKLILATTILAEDDELVDVAQKAGILVFRGSAKDVVQRLYDAGQLHRLDFVTVVGGDDVFCEGEFIDRVIAHNATQPADFITIEGLPFGTAPFGVRVAALRAVLEIKAGEYTDGWERYLTDTGLFNTTVLPVHDRELAHPEIRLDLDYYEDFLLVKAIYDRLYTPGSVPDIRRILKLLLVEEPQLARLNEAAHKRWLLNRQSMPLPMLAKGSARGMAADGESKGQ